MTFSEYKILRERLGSQDKASKILDVCVATVHKRETGRARVTREAEFAIMWAVQDERNRPSADVTRLKPQYGPGRKR